MKRILLKKAAIILIWLLIWQILALCVDNPILLASPLQTVAALARLIGTAVFWQTVAGSLLRIAGGFLLGLTAALALAILAARFRPAEDFLSPLVTLVKAVPVASFVVILLIWWGSSLLAVAICCLVVFPNIYISTLEGLKSADGRLLEMAKIFEIPYRNRFFYIYRPALQPFLCSSLKLALGMCWKSGVAAEVIGTPAFSIGERLYLSKISLDTAGILAWTTVVILLSILFEKGMLALAMRFFAWEPACSAAPERGKRTAGGKKLVCSNLAKAYGEQQVIRQFQAVYEPGEIYYLTEPSGSGKTTLLRLLCGLEEPDAGEVGCAGMRFGFLFQEDRLCEDHSALRNVEMVLGSRAGKDRGREALLGLLPEEALQKPCRQLSGGMRRRVALVRAMEADSDCVLLDEPFTGMDADTRERAAAYIRERQAGRIVIIATHR